MITKLKAIMKMKKNLKVKDAALNSKVASREANCFDKPACAGNVERLMMFIYNHGPSIVKFIRMCINLYTMSDN